MRDDEAVPQALHGAVTGSTARFCLQPVGKVFPKVEPGNRNGQQNRDRHSRGEPRHGHSRIEGDVSAQRQAIRAQLFEELDPRGAYAEPEQRSHKREQRDFHQHLADHVPAARAQRLPDCHLLRAAIGADQQQVRQVDHADQQESQRARLHQQQSGTDGSDVIGVQGDYQGTESGIGHHFRFGIVAFQGIVLRIDLRLGLRERGARFEPGNDLLDVASRMPLRGRAIFQARRKRQVHRGLRG